MKILNVDLDVFVSPILRYCSEDERPDDAGKNVRTDIEVEHFFESQCGLSADDPKPGCLVGQHIEVFHNWSQLVDSGELKVPFELFHVDAHDDLGGGIGDMGIIEACNHVVLREPGHRHRHEWQHINSGNFLTYAVACRWIKQITWVRHPDDNEPLPHLIYSNGDIRLSILEICSGGPEEFRYDGEPLPPEPVIPITLIDLDNFEYQEMFDFVFVSHSPGFIPPKADRLVEVARRYVSVSGDVGNFVNLFIKKPLLF